MLNRHIDSVIERHYATAHKALLLTGARQTDFLLEQDSEIIPLEIKSGKDYQRHVALNNLLTSTEYQIRRAIVLSNENVSVKEKVLYAPVNMTMFLHHHKQEGPIIYHPELP